MQIFIKLCNIDPDYKAYVVMREVAEGDWEQCSISLETLEDAKKFIEVRNDFELDEDY